MKSLPFCLWLKHQQLLQKIMHNREFSFIRLKLTTIQMSIKVNVEEESSKKIPSGPAKMLPKSPAWRSSSVGAPWSFLSGLKWGPAKSEEFITNAKFEDKKEGKNTRKRVNWVWSEEIELGEPVELQPLVVSPRAWIWKPWRPGESPVILPLTWVVPTQIIDRTQN